MRQKWRRRRHASTPVTGHVIATGALSCRPLRRLYPTHLPLIPLHASFALMTARLLAPRRPTVQCEAFTRHLSIEPSHVIIATHSEVEAKERSGTVAVRTRM